ncbi:hypothetical protein TorRG33x02_229940 [Trema orientale]|uniref:Uncharacterized protein n=1 Tax=Trema orientale TaxID=63057 RepID=A0A2P5E6U8_TREOI|nr:hypothetical protein TorRG33x02_229940 [Trema orientale]
MGQSEPAAEMEPITIPKLSLFSLPNQLREQPGSASPPHRASASVPFLWEEAPGKPRQLTTEPDDDETSTTVRSLGLPPRLLTEVKFTNMPSPTTVLYGPEVGRSLSFTFSFRSPAAEGSRRLTRERVGYFGSTRWGSFRKNNNKAVLGASFDISSSVNGTAATSSGHDDHDLDLDHGNVKITRVRRRGSLLSLSNTKSHLLASIYESFKQVVPWRRKQEKQRKMGSK